MMHRSTVLATGLAWACLMPAHADVDLEVNSGASANVDVTLNIGTFLGPASDSDSGSVDIISSTLRIDPDPASPPFTGVVLKDHELIAENGSLTFRFYCLFGSCAVTLNVDVVQLSLNLMNDVTVPVAGNGDWVADPNVNPATYALQMQLNYDGGSLIGQGSADATSEAVVQIAGNLSEADEIIAMTNLSIATIDLVVDPETLPDGLDSLSVTVDTDLSSLIYTGVYNACDLDGDGSVAGSDLSILLGNWGDCCAGDLDGSGTVDGADLTVLLSCWTG